MVMRRLRVLPVMLFLISLFVFSLAELAPGSTESAMLGGRPATPEALDAIRKAYHLDEPLPVQYALWARGAIVFDFGRSLRTRQPVSDLIMDRAGVTAFLGLYAFVITIIGGIGLGVISALRAGSASDRAIVATVVVGISAPAFVTGLILLVCVRGEPALVPDLRHRGGLRRRALALRAARRRTRPHLDGAAGEAHQDVDDHVRCSRTTSCSHDLAGSHSAAWSSAMGCGTRSSRASPRAVSSSATC